MIKRKLQQHTKQYKGNKASQGFSARQKEEIATTYKAIQRKQSITRFLRKTKQTRTEADDS
jgi:hypothetical protein